MNVNEFMKLTDVSRKTAYHVYNINHSHIYNDNRNFNNTDIEYIMSRKIENYNGRLANISGFPYHYVSDTGKVYKYMRNFLEEVIGEIKQGYHYVGISYNNNYKKFRVHRLVAEYFVENPYNKPTVNHKDGNKLNNDYRNLEWVTISENTKHAFDNGFIKNDIGFEDSQSSPVAFLDYNNILNVFGSITIASKMTNMEKSTISRQAISNQIEINDGMSVYDIYNSFIFYSNFLNECNEQQHRNYEILFKNNMSMLIAIR